MKKAVMILLSILTVGVVGIVISITTMDVFGAKSQEVQSYEVSQFDRINVSATSMNAMVVSDETDNIQVLVEGNVRDAEKDQAFIDVIEEDQSLTIKQKERENKISLFSWGKGKDLQVTVKIPQRKYSDLSVETTSGDIKVEKTDATKGSFKSTSGGVDLKNNSFENELYVKTTSGDVLGENNVVSNGTYETTSGSIDNKGVKGVSHQYKTTSGDVRLSNDAEVKNINIESTSGDVAVSYSEIPASLSLDFEASSGDPKINLDDMLFEEKSDHMALGRIGDGEAQNLKVRTNSGDFTLEK